MYPYLRFGPLTLGAFGIMMAVAFLCAWKALEQNMRRHKMSYPPAEILTVLLAVAGLVGARLHHTLENPSQLLTNPAILLDWSQGKAWLGGVLAGMAMLYVVAKRYKLLPLMVMDIVSPAAAIGYALGRLGCLLAGDGCYGPPTSLPWGMSFPQGSIPTSSYVHPTPIYEFIVSGLIFVFLWRISASNKPIGQVFALYLLLTGTARFFTEFIRINPPFFYGLTNAQLISLLSMTSGLLLFMAVTLPKKRGNRPHSVFGNHSQI